MKINRKKVGNLLFLAAVFAITLWSVFHDENIGEVLSDLSEARFCYIIPSIFCVISFILGESIVLCYLIRSLGIQMKFSHCCLYSFIGFFYSCITPSASGGQPMQIIAMRKDRVPVAISTVVLGIVTITYKMVLVLIGVTVLLLRPAEIFRYLEPVKELIWLGLLLNIICITGLLLIVFIPNVVQRILQWIFSIINRIAPSRHPEKQAAALERMINQYRGTAEYYRTHKNVIVHVFLITFLQRCVLFMITWFIYCSFGLSGTSPAVVVTLQAMISVAADMLPLPGGMGVSENMFLEIFLPVFGEALVLPGMVLSRGISYYTQLLVSAVMTVAASFVIRGKNK